MKTRKLIEQIKNFDNITYEHCQRVGLSASLLAKELGYNEEYCKDIKIAGFIHDAGKLKVPIELLNKNGYLTEKEFEIIQGHVSYGKKIVEKLEDCKEIYIQAASEHHAGYKNVDLGYYAEDLTNYNKPSETAQIMAVCDIYDALANKRSYKEAMPETKIMEILDEEVQKGKLNPEIHKVFINKVMPKVKIINGKSLEYIESFSKLIENANEYKEKKVPIEIDIKPETSFISIKYNNIEFNYMPDEKHLSLANKKIIELSEKHLDNLKELSTEKDDLENNDILERE